MKPEQEQEFADKIVGRLNQGLEHIGTTAEQRLQAARRVALNHYHDTPRPVAGLAWAGWGVLGHERFAAARNMAIAMLIAVSVVGVFYHHQIVQPENELVETEISLLTGELPINAYLDEEFHTWLKQSQQ